MNNDYDIAVKNADGVTISDYTYINATLYVPAGSIDKYKATEGWKNFSLIKEG